MWQAQEFMRRVGRALRTNDDVAREPLPERWIDLIRYLDEKERMQSQAQQSETEPHVQRRPRSN
jgi:hypothetical protein